MRTMKIPAYILHDILHWGAATLQRPYEPLFWYGVWLRRDAGLPAASMHEAVIAGSGYTDV